MERRRHAPLRHAGGAALSAVLSAVLCGCHPGVAQRVDQRASADDPMLPWIELGYGGDAAPDDATASSDVSDVGHAQPDAPPAKPECPCFVKVAWCGAGVQKEADQRRCSVPLLPAHADDILHCPGGAWAVKEPCAAGCIEAPAGTPDSCKPVNSGKTHENPVVPFDCPDPGILAVTQPARKFYMVCTGGSFPIRSSDDLVSWADTGSAILPGGKAP
jgi:hypothetical protein